MAEITITDNEDIIVTAGADENMVSEVSATENIESTLAVFDGGGTGEPGGNYGTIEYL